jgi:hypothetical protein
VNCWSKASEASRLKIGRDDPPVISEHVRHDCLEGVRRRGGMASLAKARKSSILPDMVGHKRRVDGKASRIVEIRESERVQLIEVCLSMTDRCDKAIEFADALIHSEHSTPLHRPLRPSTHRPKFPLQKQLCSIYIPSNSHFLQRNLHPLQEVAQGYAPVAGSHGVDFFFAVS